MAVTKTKETPAQAGPREKTAGTVPAAKPPAREEGFCVYIGPSIRSRVQYGAVFPSRRAAEEMLAEELARFPAFGIFLAGGAELPQARIDVRTPGTALFAMAARLRDVLANQ